MPLSDKWLIVQSFVTTALYQLLRLVFITVQRIYWQLNGTAQKLREARLSHNYQRSAQVLDVVLWHKFSEAQATTLGNFLCTHTSFENPQYIIDNDNITLLTVNEHDAVFCEAKEKGRTRIHFPDESPSLLPHSLEYRFIFFIVTHLIIHYSYHSFIQGSNLTFSTNLFTIDCSGNHPTDFTEIRACSNRFLLLVFFVNFL